VTRLLGGYIAGHPDIYPSGSADATREIAHYEQWAERMHDGWPYRDFSIEYPPGALPFFSVPDLVDPFSYRTEFIVLCIALDAAGLVAIVRIARRTGHWWGVAAWLALLPALGPITYARYDLAVAVALAWALERALAGRWTAAGAWTGVGAAVKIVPTLLVPLLAATAPRRWRPVVAAGAVVAVSVAPFILDLGELYGDVIGFHTHRGIHAESLWGSFALLAHRFVDMGVEKVGAFGATDVEFRFAGAVQVLANLVSVAVVTAGTWLAWRRVRRGDGTHVVLVAAATLILVTAVGRVFSPQYLVWLVAVMAAGLSVAPQLLRAPAILLAVAVVLAHAVYPVAFYHYLELDAWALLLGAARGVALLGAGLLAAAAAWRYRPPTARDSGEISPADVTGEMTDKEE
jgi:hypothetical protein